MSLIPGDRRRVRMPKKPRGPAYEPIREREPVYPVVRGPFPSIGHGAVWITVSCAVCAHVSLVAKGATLAAAAAVLEANGWRWELGEGPRCEACATRPEL